MNFAQADDLNEAIRAIGIRHRTLAMTALAPLGIHPGHKLLLLELERAGPRTQAQLAEASGYEPPTITQSLRLLETAGLVVRAPSSTDRRATIVDLTDSGRAVLPKLKKAWRQVAEQTVAGLSAADIERITVILSTLAERMAAGAGPSADVPRYARRSDPAGHRRSQPSS